MPTIQTLNDKITDAFTKLPTVQDQKRCLENMIIAMESRIELENKELQDKINSNLKLKEGK